MISKFEEFSQKINPFDMNQIYDHVEFKHPLYSILSKDRSAILKYMNPKEYIKYVGENLGLTYQETIDSNAVSIEKARKYAQDMLSGDKFPIPYIVRDSSSQEGRHRAIAAIEIGIDKIPVIEFFNLSYDEVKNIAYSLKDKQDSVVKDFLIKRGFNNFTDLDKRELKNIFNWKF
jgi:hypothetical protein